MRAVRNEATTKSGNGSSRFPSLLRAICTQNIPTYPLFLLDHREKLSPGTMLTVPTSDSLSIYNSVPILSIIFANNNLTEMPLQVYFQWEAAVRKFN
jgi:hypothetical protein